MAKLSVYGDLNPNLKVAYIYVTFSNYRIVESLFIHKDRFLIEYYDKDDNSKRQEIVFNNLNFQLKKKVQISKTGSNPLLLEITCSFEFTIDLKVIKSRKQSTLLWLNDYFETICANCRNIIIPLTRFRNVFPLPENNWGESTDMWFCHDEGDDFKNTQLTPGDNVLISQFYFCVSKQVYSYNETLEEGKTNENDVSCCRCRSTIGCKNNVDSIIKEAVKFYRSAVVVNDTQNSRQRRFDAYTIADIICRLVEESESHRIVIECPLPNGKIQAKLLLWILNEDCPFYDGKVETESTRLPLHRCVKVLYLDTFRDKGRLSREGSGSRPVASLVVDKQFLQPAKHTAMAAGQRS
ncbi:DgyrCDS6996 [Dimorphilus gyrociliatus]|uniref:E3 ubiquitin-protein ligase E3D n=1 Tax=Dimorphilus gyrociliatus TaxID=2664684 RepID=A0A7I8VRE1_9ANNE|nr:DgyrCDS6996 [Dimorphilus gyrociliatus]